MRASGIPRGDIFLTTKVSHENLRADDFARSVDESLAALKVDYVDLLMVHWPNPDHRACRNHAGAGQGQAAGAGAPYRRCQFQYRAARSGGRALPRAAGRLAGRVSSLSRPVEALGRGAPAQARLHRLLSAGARTPVRRSGARRHRREARPQRRAGRAALAHPAGRRRHSVLVEAASASPTISTCSISRSTTTRWRASPRSSAPTAASPIRPGACPAAGT